MSMRQGQNDLCGEKKQLMNQSSHSLIYSIGEYRRPVTDMAIECVRKQSLGNVCSESIKKVNSLNSNNNNYNTYHNYYQQQHCRLNQPSFNSISTKKKRFNYGVAQQSQIIFSNNYHSYSQQNKINTISTSKYNQLVEENIKVYSSGLKKIQQNNYLTQPFCVLEEQQERSKIECEGKMKRNKVGQKSVNKTKSNSYAIQPNTIKYKPVAYDNYQNKIQSTKHPLSFQSITINKQGISIQKPIKLVQKQLFKQKQPIKSNTKQQSHPITYPKAETYTSRSDYNIEKLTNKLDSYIKKYITNQ